MSVKIANEILQVLANDRFTFLSAKEIGQRSELLANVREEAIEKSLDAMYIDELVDMSISDSKSIYEGFVLRYRFRRFGNGENNLQYDVFSDAQKDIQLEPLENRPCFPTRDVLQKDSILNVSELRKGSLGNKGHVAPYGYLWRNEKLVQVPSEILVVKTVFELLNKGMTLESIANQLNNKGFRTRTGKHFLGATVHHIKGNREVYEKNHVVVNTMNNPTTWKRNTQYMERSKRDSLQQTTAKIQQSSKNSSSNKKAKARYGFTRVGANLVENPAESEIVRQVLRLLYQRYTLQEVADIINAKGYRTREGFCFSCLDISSISAQKSFYDWSLGIVYDNCITNHLEITTKASDANCTETNLRQPEQDVAKTVDNELATLLKQFILGRLDENRSANELEQEFKTALASALRGRGHESTNGDKLNQDESGILVDTTAPKVFMKQLLKGENSQSYHRLYYGYSCGMNGSPEISSNEAHVVRIIFYLAQKDYTLKQTAEALKILGYRNRTGVLFDSSRISVIRNQTNIYCYRDTAERALGNTIDISYPPIIGENDEFIDVQEEILQYEKTLKTDQIQVMDISIYGYRLREGKLIIEAKEAEAIRIMMLLEQQGFTYVEIANEVNRLGYKTLYGANFVPTTVKKILLRRDFYAGKGMPSLGRFAYSGRYDAII